MSLIEELYDISIENNIAIDTAPLDGVKGVSTKIDEEFYIILAKRILSSSRELRDVLAEELGHCCTNSLYMINVPNEELRRLNVGKYEHIARVWAIRHLASAESIRNALRCNDCDMWITADELELSYEQLQFAIDYYQSVGELD